MIAPEKFLRIAAAYRAAAELAEERQLTCANAFYVLCATVKKTIGDEIPASFTQTLARIGMNGCPDYVGLMRRECESWTALASEYSATEVTSNG